MGQDLAAEYKRQFEWRDWGTAISFLPTFIDKTVFDMGCGVGDLSAELAARGALVVGIDANEEMISHARSRQIAGAEFHIADLREPHEPAITADGIWCSFTFAYFADPGSVIRRWARILKPGGWIAITEINDLFGHEPLSLRTQTLFREYCDEAAAAGRYDFRAGGKIRGHLEEAGFRVSNSLTLADRELSFQGPAESAVLEAWRARFDRMGLLQDFLGADFSRVRDEFLTSLTRTDHVSQAQVCFCLAVKAEAADSIRD